MIIYIPAAFNEELYESVATATDRRVCSVIMDRFDAAMSAGQFDFCNTVLKTIDIKRLSVQAMVTLVTCARWARQYIEEYDRFYKAALDATIAQYGAARADDIYRGLK